MKQETWEATTKRNKICETYFILLFYFENLEELQHNKMYKYSGLWNCKEYLEKENFSIATLTYYPIYCKQFEYLVKMGLYALACDCAYAIKKKNNFKETFGVEKKYYLL